MSDVTPDSVSGSVPEKEVVESTPGQLVLGGVKEVRLRVKPSAGKSPIEANVGVSDGVSMAEFSFGNSNEVIAFIRGLRMLESVLTDMYLGDLTASEFRWKILL